MNKKVLDVMKFRESRQKSETSIQVIIGYMTRQTNYMFIYSDN